VTAISSDGRAGAKTGPLASSGAPSVATIGHPALVVRGLGHRYGRHVALSDVDLIVAAGSITAVIGPNGAGKSSLLRVCAGLLPLQAGTVDIGGQGGPENIEARQEFTYVPDVPSGYERLTIGEYVGLYGSLQKAGPVYEAMIRAQLEAMRLAGSMNRELGGLSEGTRRKVSIIAAFAAARQLVMVDEATAALDPEAVLVVESLLKWLRGSARAALIATQDLDFAERVSDHVVLLHDGRVVAADHPARLRARFGADSLRGVFAAATGLLLDLQRLGHALEAAANR
jgi:ABC-type multidrug transport system ATPase subunit